MKTKFVCLVFIPFFLFTLTNCSDRNITDVLEPPLPQGERLFSPDWEVSAELDNSEVTSLELTFSSYIVAGSENGNFFRSKYYGDSWSLIPASSYPITVIHRARSSFVFAGNTIGELFKSLHNGREWEKALSLNSAINSIITLEDNSVLVGTNNGLFYSEGNDLNFNPVSTFNSLSVYSVLQYKDNILFAGTSEGLFKSIDNGITWSKTNVTEKCFSLAKSFNGDIYAGTSNGVYRAKEGENWFLTGLEGIRVNSVAVTKEIHVFAGTHRNGIFYSNNSGYSWTGFGFADKTINCILEYPLQDMIFAATGKFVYRIRANN